ncbi:hypothetical protein E2562_023873 [Oryza meyeriana var. granulata]|uniref:Uncharacterized protein n=1 Tax=Oryza meyeriana var. granulata TaxID=110450 RepID=A0A6G1D602_9ORYZ|nr:hypothetical protein E2562_023873 [Oryza meyeriana var. granulata]
MARGGENGDGGSHSAGAGRAAGVEGSADTAQAGSSGGCGDLSRTEACGAWPAAGTGEREGARGWATGKKGENLDRILPERETTTRTGNGGRKLEALRRPPSPTATNPPPRPAPAPPGIHLRARSAAHAPQVDFAGGDGPLESPKAIPTASTPGGDGANNLETKKIQDNMQTSNSTRVERSNSISSCINRVSLGDSDGKESVISGENAQSNLSSQPKPSKKPAARAKVPFEKGYSQMDWLKLTRTHPDLAGYKAHIVSATWIPC